MADSPPGERRVSVVIPTHGRPALLARALESVRAQTHPPVEVIVVDDTGDPEVAGVVEPFEGTRLLQRAHDPGPARSRNLGAAEAIGDVLAFLDDDDTWAPPYLRRALATNADLTLTWIGLIERGEVRPWRGIDAGLPPAAFFSQNPGVVGSNIVVTKTAFESVGGLDERLLMSEDKDLMIRLLDAGHRYAVVREPLVIRGRHDEERLTDLDSPRHADGLRRFLAKHGARMSRSDRRRLQSRIDTAVALSGRRRDRVLSVVRLASRLELGRLKLLLRTWASR